MRKQSTSASVDLVKILVQYAAGQGLDPATLLAGAGLAAADLSAAGGRVPARRLGELWRELVQRSGDPNFGLHVGVAGDRLASGGILAAVMANCATAAAALERLARYHSLATDFIQLRLERQGEWAAVVCAAVDGGLALNRHYSETVMCNLVLPLRRVTQGRVQPVEIHFQHPRPGDTREQEGVFGCRLVFDCDRNELILRGEDLDQPIFLANPQVLAALDGVAQEMLARLHPAGSWADRVAQRIHQGLVAGEKPGLEGVARELAISPRQLQNKLRAEGCTYQGVLDEVRKELALQYLGRPQLTVCDVAFLLGFAEQSAFNHAFKRWTGGSPRDYR